MQHLDDRVIAEYLDGETPAAPVERHLVECAECRARVEAARGVRAGAREILSDSAPRGLATPPFDEVLARAGRPGPRARRRVSARALAWAATIVVAFGAGWWLRRPTLVQVPIADTVLHLPALDRPAGQPTANTSGSSTVAITPPTRSPAPMPPASRESPSATTPAPASSGAEPGTASAKVAAAAAAPKPARAADAVGQLQEDAARSVAAAPQVMEANGGHQGFTALENGISPIAWAPASRTDAERALGARVHVIRGLPAFYTTGVMGGGPVVRVEQRLADGAVVTLLESRRAQSAPMPRALGGVKLEFEKDGVVIQASATVAADSLARLIADLD